MGYGLDLVKGVGSSAAGSIVSEGLGLLTQGIKNRQQLKQAGRLQELEIKGSKEMNDYNMAKQLQMWKDTSYGAQVEQMNKAGINPALMYGMGGGGGQTTGSASGGVSGQHAETSKGSGADGMGLMIGQMGLLEAQKKNIEADTKLKEVEANKKGGADTALANAQAASLIQGIENAKAQKVLTDIEADIASTNARIMYKSEDAQVKAWEQLVEKSSAEIRGLVLSNSLNDAQLKDKVELLKVQVTGERIKNGLMRAQTDLARSGIKLNNAQIDKIAADIANATRSLDQTDRSLSQKDREIALQAAKVELEKVKTQYDATHPGLWNALGGLLERTINWSDELFGTENWGKPIKK